MHMIYDLDENGRRAVVGGRALTSHSSRLVVCRLETQRKRKHASITMGSFVFFQTTLPLSFVFFIILAIAQQKKEIVGGFVPPKRL